MEYSLIPSSRVKADEEPSIAKFDRKVKEIHASKHLHIFHAAFNAVEEVNEADLADYK